MNPPRIKVMPRPQQHMTPRLFVGLLAAYAEPDEWDERLSTVRIDGHDLLAAMHDDYTRMGAPVSAVMVLNGRKIETPNLYFHLGHIEDGCGDGCCGGYSDHELRVGGYRGDDFLAQLRDHHGKDVAFLYRFTGYVEPTVRVALAHPYKGKSAREQIDVPLSEAKRLGRAKRLWGYQNDRVGALR